MATKETVPSDWCYNHDEVLKVQAKIAEDAIEALRQDFDSCFSTEWGQRVLAHLVEWAGVFKPSFVPGDRDSTIFNEGNRNAILYILSLADRNNLDDVRYLWKSLETQGR